MFQRVTGRDNVSKSVYTEEIPILPVGNKLHAENSLTAKNNGWMNNINNGMTDEGRGSEYSGVEQQLVIRTGSNCTKININEIIFLETAKAKHKVKIHTENSLIECYGALRHILRLLDENIFIRCHKSYIVNTAHIKKVDKKERYIVTSNEETCLVSRKFMKHIITKCFI